MSIANRFHTWKAQRSGPPFAEPRNSPFGRLRKAMFVIFLISSSAALQQMGYAQEWRPTLVQQSGHSASVNALAFTPDSHSLISASHDFSVRLWDLRTGREVRTLGKHTREVLTLAMCPDGRCVLSGSADKTLKLWEVPSGRLLHTFVGHTSAIHNAVFTADGKQIISAAGAAPAEESRQSDFTARIWDANTGQLLRKLEGHQKIVASAALSQDGRLIATGSFDATIKIWSFATGKLIRTIDGFSPGGVRAQFTHDGCCLLSASKGRLELLDIGTGQHLRILAEDPLPYQLALNPTTPQVAYATRNILKILDLRTNRLVATFPGPEKLIVESIAFSPDGKEVASGYSNGTIKLWNVQDRKEIWELRGYTSEVSSVAVSSDGHWIASGNEDSSVRVWDTVSGLMKWKLKSENRDTRALIFSPDNRSLVTAGGDPSDKVEDRPIEVWDIRTGAKLFSLDFHVARVQSLAFSPNGKWLASAAGTSAKIWDIVSRKEVQTLSPVNQIVGFTKDSQRIVTGGTDNNLTLWEISTGRAVSRLPNVGWARSMSQNGHWLASLGWDKEFKLFNLQDGRTFTLSGHHDFVYDLAFSPDSKLLASCSFDGGIKLWDVYTHRDLRTLSGHTSWVSSIKFSSDGRLLFSVSHDGSLRIWDVSKGKQLVSVMAMRDTEDWLAVAPDGLFDGTAEAMQRVAWRLGQTDTTVSLESFFSDFFRPGLIGEIIAGEQPKAQVDIATLVQVPGLRHMLSQNRAHLEIRAGKAIVCFEELPGVALGIPAGESDLPSESRGFKIVPDDISCKYRKELADTGDVQTLVKSLQSWKPTPFVTQWDGKLSITTRSTLHILSIGVAQYPRASGLDPLPYAVKSAQAVEKFFVQQKSLDRRAYARIRVWPGLYDQEASRDSIRRTLEKMSQVVDEDDVVVLYFGGHGLVTPEEEMFYFIPSDGRVKEIRNTGLNTASLAEALRRMPARRIVLILDTCQSGAAVEALSKIGEAKARLEQRRMHDSLGPANSRSGIGVHVIAATLPLAYAVQLHSDQSALVATLLGSLSQRSGPVTVSEVIRIVRQRLPEASEKEVGFRQVPLADSVGLDFPLSSE